jgi:hypothetical protein
MRVYTVHMRRPTLDPDRDIRLVKDGFNWPAFFFSIVWALWCRLWLVAGILLAAETAIAAAMAALGGDGRTQLIISIGSAVIVGLVANDLKRWTLFRRGYLEVGVVTGSDIDAAERRFWDQRPHLAADLVR